MKNETSDQISDAAAQWAARMDRSPLNSEEQARLDAWLATDTRRLGALMRARAALMRFDGLHAVDVPPEPQVPAAPVVTRRRALAGGAGLLAAGLAGLLLWPAAATYRTGLGEVRMIPLEDGSVATLNTQSEIQVSFSEDRRLIRLVRGEGYFEVAKDKARPFVVATGDAEVRAVGTAFTVRALPGQAIDVRVHEGVVELRDMPAARAIRLNANMQAVVARDAGGPVRTERLAPGDVDRALSWREGKLSFERSTLDSAVAEFNRYNDVRIVLASPDLGRRRVTGLFAANDPRGFADAVAMTLGLDLAVDGSSVRLSGAAGEAAP